jgi:hypothetical protein
MNNKHILLFIACFITFYSCKKPPAVTNKDISTTEAKPETLQVQLEEIDFDYFSTRSKVNFRDQNEDQTATVNIRMKKDSLIWLSVNKVGIEGFRALITRDSIYVLDQVKKEYFVKDFKSLSEQFNFTISYDLLQSVVMGNLPFKTLDRKALKVNNYYLLRQENGALTVDNFIGQQNRKLEKVEMTEQPSQNKLTLNYENFGPLNNFLYPYNSALHLKYVSNQQSLNTLITVECKKAEIHTEELKFPFNIPKRYERK